jgi:acetyl-CoA carboxylase biotin carboxyl carrier protein
MSRTAQVTAPIPGTFYHKKSPTSPPFVTVGDVVTVGDTIGLVEVMKMFNPVATDVAGTLVEIVAGDEEPVDVGDVLVLIEVGDG